MDWRSLNKNRESKGIDLYLAALKYAQVLWLKNLPARALLAVDRALLTDLTGNEVALKTWPLPYRAMSWMIVHYEDEAFVGNPRVHFQHLASRVRGERKDQRKWRAWACWYLARQARPWLDGDEKQNLTEPTLEEIFQGIDDHGIAGELNLLKEVVAEKALV